MFLRVLVLCVLSLCVMSCSSTKPSVQPDVLDVRDERPLGVPVPAGTFALVRADLGALGKASSQEKPDEYAGVVARKMIQMASSFTVPTIHALLHSPLPDDVLDVLAGLDTQGELVIAVSTVGNEGLDPWMHGAPVMDVDRHAPGILSRVMLPAKDPELLVSMLYDLHHQRKLVQSPDLIASVFVQGQYVVMDIRSLSVDASIPINRKPDIPEDKGFFESRESPAMKAFLARDSAPFGMYFDARALPFVAMLKGFEEVKSALQYATPETRETLFKSGVYQSASALLFRDESIMEYEDAAIVVHVGSDPGEATLDMVQSLTPLGEQLYTKLPASNDVITRFVPEVPLFEATTRQAPVKDTSLLRGPAYIDAFASLEPSVSARELLRPANHIFPVLMLGYAPGALQFWFEQKGLAVAPSTSSIGVGARPMSEDMRFGLEGGYIVNGVIPALYDEWLDFFASRALTGQMGVSSARMLSVESEEEHAYIVKRVRDEARPPMVKAALPENTSVQATLYGAHLVALLSEIGRLPEPTQYMLDMLSRVPNVTLSRVHQPTYVHTHIGMEGGVSTLDLSSLGTRKIKFQPEPAAAPCEREAVARSFKVLGHYVSTSVEHRVEIGRDFIKENEARRERCAEGSETITSISAHWHYMHAETLTKASLQDEARLSYDSACKYGMKSACDAL